MSFSHTNTTHETLRDGTKVTTTTKESRTVGGAHIGTITPRLRGGTTITPTRLKSHSPISRTITEQRVSVGTSGVITGHTNSVYSGKYTGPILDGGKQTVPLNQRIS